MSNNNSEFVNFQFKKDNVWKYATVIMALVLVVVIVINLSGKGGSTAGSIVSATDLGVITDNPSLFPSLGPENSDTTVVEFIDFQCPFCGLAAGNVPWADKYRAQYADLVGSSAKVKALAEAGELRLVMVTMSFLGPESVYSAQAGLCANKQGKFFVLEDALYEAQTEGENTGKYSKANLKIIAEGISGLDQSEFAKCLDDDETLSDVQQVANTARQFVTGTPAFFVNGKKVSPSWNALSQAIGV